jgi:hypothetical protein
MSQSMETFMTHGGSYDQETVVLLRAVLDDAWASLLPQQRSVTPKSEVAMRILRLATRGERDPVKLRAGALIDFRCQLS